VSSRGCRRCQASGTRSQQLATVQGSRTLPALPRRRHGHQGARNGSHSDVQLRRMVVGKLEPEDIINITAYLAFRWAVRTIR
jgi:hypothetical protein